jgi:hypothetical protein
LGKNLSQPKILYIFVIQFKLIKYNTMRKLFALLSVATVMTLASCGAKSDESAAAADSVVTDTTTTVPAADSVAAPVDSVAAPAADSAKTAPAAH